MVVRHEPMLSGTTNVSDLTEFSDRKTTKNIDGIDIEDWFVCDFTLKELKTLRARQAMKDRPQEYNDLYSIPTFQEVINLVKDKSKENKQKDRYLS